MQICYRRYKISSELLSYISEARICKKELENKADVREKGASSVTYLINTHIQFGADILRGSGENLIYIETCHVVIACFEGFPNLYWRLWASSDTNTICSVMCQTLRLIGQTNVALDTNKYTHIQTNNLFFL